jgi:hypothetical protein
MQAYVVLLVNLPDQLSIKRMEMEMLDMPKIGEELIVGDRFTYELVFVGPVVAQQWFEVICRNRE